MADTAVVARAGHVVVVEQRGVARGEVFLGGQVLEGRRQAVGAVLLRHAAGLPQRVLQTLGQGCEALAALDHLHMLPAGEGQHEVVQDVDERLAGDGDTQLGHRGEVRQAAVAGGVVLGEEHFLAWPFQGPPLPDVALQGAQHTIGVVIRVVVLQLAQQRDGHQVRRTLEQRNDLGVPDRGERIDARAPVTTGCLRRQRGGTINAARAALADAGLGSGQFLGLGLAIVHVEANLLIGDVGTWQWGPTSRETKTPILNPTNPAPPVARRLRRLRRLRLLTTGHHVCRSTGQDDCRAPQCT